MVSNYNIYLLDWTKKIILLAVLNAAATAAAEKQCYKLLRVILPL